MNPELDRKLVEACPNLYRQRNGDIRQSCMPFGFPGDGWFNLLWDLSLKLEKLIVDNIPDEDKIIVVDYRSLCKDDEEMEWKLNKYGIRSLPSWDEETKTYTRNENPRHSVYASQVKEKLGGLRFYLSMGSDEMYDLCHEAENKSYEICETCGEPGVLRDSGWIITACDEHSDGHPPLKPYWKVDKTPEVEV